MGSKKPRTTSDEAAPAKAGPPRPDEMSADMFEFISAINQYKRDELRSFLQLEEILAVIERLGYELAGVGERGAEPPVEDLAQALATYKRRHGRLFPNWSEIYGLLLGLGYERRGGGSGGARARA